MNTSPYIVVLDIGYSNMTAMHGQADGRISEFTVPATAIRKEPEQYSEILSSMGKKKNTEVVVNGEPWVVGVEPFRVGKGKRELNSGFTKTDAFKAMYFGCLTETKADVIDLLVTGLPVEQALDKTACNQLVKSLTGRHKINRKRSVQVNKVVVLPQPVGGFIDYLNNFNDDNIYIQSGTILIIDPGFYSVDHIMIQRGRFLPECSGTSLYAVSALLEETSRLIKEAHGKIDKELIEDAIQNGNRKVLVKGKVIELDDYLKTASLKVCDNAITSIKENLRQQESIDMTILVGGGAEFYEESAKRLLDYCGIFKKAEDSHKAIARGYLITAKEQARKINTAPQSLSNVEA